MANQIGGTIVWNLDADDSAFVQKLNQAQGKAKDFSNTLDKDFSSMAQNLSNRLGSVSKSVDNVGNAFIKIGVIPTAALGLASKSAIDFEDNMADVRKTVGLTAEGTQALGNELLTLSKSTRTSASDLVDIAKIAGQLGVASGQVVPFTKAINEAAVALGDEFVGGAEEVTKELGTLVNQFKLAGKNGEQIAEGVTKVGSAINALGAAGQATGPFMTDFGRRVGGIAPIVGLSIDKVLGLGAALQELGQAPEVAGTAIQSLLVTMGKNVNEFAKIAGVSGSAFSKLLREDINEALLLVSKGISGGSTSVEDLANKLDGLGIDGQRTVAVLANLGNNTDLVREKQALANRELAKGTSLTDEYNIKNNTAAANTQKFWNNINALSVTIGTALLPAINANLARLIPLVQTFADFAAANPGLVTGVLAAGAAFTTLGIALKGVAIALKTAKDVTDAAIWIKNSQSIATAIGGIRTAFLALNLALGPIGWTILAITAAIGVLALAWNNNWFDIQGKTKASIDTIMKFLAPLVPSLQRVADAFTGLFDLVVNGDFEGSFGRALGISEDSKIVDSILNVRNALIGTFAVIRDLFTGGDVTATWYQHFGTTFMGIAKFLDNAQHAFISFVDFVKTLPQRTAAALQALPGAISAALANAGLSFVRFLGFLTGLVIYGIPKLVDSIVNFFLTLPERLWNTFVTVGLTLVRAFGFMVGLVIFGLPKVIDAIIGFFLTLPARLDETFGGVLASLSNWTISMGTWAAVAIPAFIDSVVAFFLSLPGRIGDALNMAFNAIVNWGISSLNWLLINVPLMIDSVVNFFLKLPGRIKEALILMGLAIAFGFISAWDWLKANVPKIIDSVVNFFATLPGRITEWLVETWKAIVAEVSTWPARLYEWGVNIAKSFADGVKSAIGAIVDAFKGGLNDAKKFVEGHSPPIAGPFKNIDVWGYNVGMAWVDGVRKAVGSLSFESPTLAMAGVPNVAPAVARGGSGGKGIGNLINIEHMEVRDDSDITEVSRDLAFRVETSSGFINNG